MILGHFIGLAILIVVTYWMRPRKFSLDPGLSGSYVVGVLFRIFGTLLYLYYAFFLSGGAVDAFIYDNYAAKFAEYFMRGDLSPFTDPSLWRNGELFYTNFVAYPAAIFMILTNGSLFGIYLLFSLVCFAGLVLMIKAFMRNYPNLKTARITWLLFLFPALWFWTSTIGKDAFMFLGIGLVCHGITDKRLNYFKIALGLAIIYVFRPPTAYMVILALSAIFILNSRDSIPVRVTKIVFGIVVFLLVLNYLSSLWGIEDFSEESIADLQSGVLRNNDFGSGALEQKAGGFSSIPQGIVDVLARPFLWEATNLLALASALEINFVLILLLLNRSSVARFVRESLNHRLSAFVLAFVSIYILSVGLFENNIGLIARHRAMLFPFLFLMAYGYTQTVRQPLKTRKKRIVKFPVQPQHVKQ